MQRLESKKSRTRSASTRRRSKADRDFSYITDENTERFSRPRLTENLTNIPLNDEITTASVINNNTSKLEKHDERYSNASEQQKVKKRNSIFTQLAQQNITARKSLGPLLDMELSKHATQFTGLALPQSHMVPAQFKAQIQVNAQDLAITQAKLFAEACAQAMAKADEIAQIEADAQLTYVPPDFHENIQQTLNRSRSSSKNKGKLDARRLPVIPQSHKVKKENQPIYSNRSKSHEQRRVAFTSKTNNPQLSATNSRNEVQKSPAKKEYDIVEKLLIKEQLLKKQQELLIQEKLSRQKLKNQMQELANKSKRTSLCSTNNYLY